MSLVTHDAAVKRLCPLLSSNTFLTKSDGGIRSEVYSFIRRNCKGNDCMFWRVECASVNKELNGTGVTYTTKEYGYCGYAGRPTPVQESI